MATVPKQLFKGQINNLSTTRYTVPTGTTTILKNIVAYNNTSGVDTKIWIGDGSYYYIGINVTAGETVTVDVSMVLTAGQTITTMGNSGTNVNLFMSGVEIS